MTTRKDLADWIIKGQQDPRIIEELFQILHPNLRRKSNDTNDFETTGNITVRDERMRQIGITIPLHTISANVIGLALIGKFGSPESAWQIYCQTAFPIPRVIRAADHDVYSPAAQLLEVKSRTIKRLVSFHTGMSEIAEIVKYLYDQDPILFGNDHL